VMWSVAIAIIVVAKFLPTALRALTKNKNIKDYLKGH
jgi:hypothetical protein